jgi:phage terminase large subunit GpA-like protein
VSDKSLLKKYFNDRPFRRGLMTLKDYAETTVLPTGKYRGVKFSHSRAPYLIEPLDLLSGESPYQEVRCQFPAQTGKSTLAEMFIEYNIVETPAEIMYVSSNETAAIRFMQRRIEPRCALKGVEFRSEVTSASARRTGDTQYSKLFNGGCLDVASSLSPSQLASETKSRVVADEVDRWKLSISHEGNPLDILYARMQAWGDEKKLLIVSTPTTEDASLMNQLYLEGDQRLYYVPCPYCQTKQLLDFFHGRGFGLTWGHKSGKILKKSIEYICESCGKPIKENEKQKMLIGGEWRPTALPSVDHIASFHINGLYSPFLSWYDMAIAYEESLTGPVKKQAFENLKMGRPYRETGTRPKVEKIIENRGTYKAGTVPDGVLYLTMGIDVQRGSENNENNNARIEAQIIGVGAGYRTWVIDYIVFDGDITDPYGGAWEKLNQFGLDTELTFYRSDGFGFPVSVVFIDSGDGSASDIVYRFCSRWQNTYPIKGRADITRRKKDAPDEVIQGNMQRYRASKLDEDTLIYLVNTNFFKARIYHGLKIERQEGDIQRPGFIDFPRELDEKYFNGLTAEERKRDGSFHNPGGRRNEPLDTMVYALCAADVFLDSEVINYRMWAQQNGANKADLQKITHKTVLENMTVSTARKKVEKK